LQYAADDEARYPPTASGQRRTTSIRGIGGIGIESTVEQRRQFGKDTAEGAPLSRDSRNPLIEPGSAFGPRRRVRVP
jgi:hypothetical protein